MAELHIVDAVVCPKTGTLIDTENCGLCDHYLPDDDPRNILPRESDGILICNFAEPTKEPSVKIEIWENYTLQNRVYIGYFKTADEAKAYLDANYGDLNADCIAVNDQILLGWDEWNALAVPEAQE